MVYLIFIFMLILAVLILWGLFILLTKKPYIFASLIIAIFITYEFSVYQFHLGFMPDGMGIWRQLYAKEKAWGIGMPGDNETGLIVFELPNRTSERVMKDGIDYLKTLKPGEKCSDEWLETPKLNNPDWFNTENHYDKTPNVEHYLYRYGFYIPLDTKIIYSINQSISATGSYVSYCRGGGAVIVMPKINRIALAYSG